jgi:hypothetical protein
MPNATTTATTIAKTPMSRRARRCQGIIEELQEGRTAESQDDTRTIEIGQSSNPAILKSQSA